MTDENGNQDLEWRKRILASSEAKEARTSLEFQRRKKRQLHEELQSAEIAEEALVKRLKTEEDHITMQSIFYLEILKINKDQPRYFLQYQYPYVYFILPNTFIRNWSRKVDLASGGCRTEDWLVYFIFLSSYTRTGSLVITGPETTKSSSN